MSEKKEKNKVKNIIWDYYLTNREVRRQNDEYNKEQPETGWNQHAKVYLAIIVIGVIGIIIRYVVF